MPEEEKGESFAEAWGFEVESIIHRCYVEGEEKGNRKSIINMLGSKFDPRFNEQKLDFPLEQLREIISKLKGKD